MTLIKATLPINSLDFEVVTSMEHGTTRGTWNRTRTFMYWVAGVKCCLLVLLRPVMYPPFPPRWSGCYVNNKSTKIRTMFFLSCFTVVPFIAPPDFIVPNNIDGCLFKKSYQLHHCRSTKPAESLYYHILPKHNAANSLLDMVVMMLCKKHFQWLQSGVIIAFS